MKAKEEVLTEKFIREMYENSLSFSVAPEQASWEVHGYFEALLDIGFLNHEEYLKAIALNYSILSSFKDITDISFIEE